MKGVLIISMIPIGGCVLLYLFLWWLDTHRDTSPKKMDCREACRHSDNKYRYKDFCGKHRVKPIFCGCHDFQDKERNATRQS